MTAAAAGGDLAGSYDGASGPRVVAIGGGHGLSATLAALRFYAGSITGIVSVADDGGSSGRLRSAFGMPPPGDLRKCLVALAQERTLFVEAFEHRFSGGELDGHALGNLVIAGLFAVSGDLASALDEAGRVLGTRGRILPASSGPVVLAADVGATAEIRRVEGQVSVGTSRRIRRVAFEPADPPVAGSVLDAIAVADQIVMGPGSLYTSVLAAAAIPMIRDAIARSPAQRVYVCNLREQVPETEGYDAGAHVRALLAHGVPIDAVVWDPGSLDPGVLDHPEGHRDLWHVADLPAGHTGPVRLARAPWVVPGRVASSSGTVHDPSLLGPVLDGTLRQWKDRGA